MGNTEDSSADNMGFRCAKDSPTAPKHKPQARRLHRILKSRRGPLSSAPAPGSLPWPACPKEHEPECAGAGANTFAGAKHERARGRAGLGQRCVHPSACAYTRGFRFVSGVCVRPEQEEASSAGCGRSAEGRRQESGGTGPGARSRNQKQQIRHLTHKQAYERARAHTRTCVPARIQLCFLPHFASFLARVLFLLSTPFISWHLVLFACPWRNLKMHCDRVASALASEAQNALAKPLRARHRLVQHDCTCCRHSGASRLSRSD
eukprot:6203929-Pleurochrysis_carterae.AAC.3